MARIPAALRIGVLLLTVSATACQLADVFAASGPRDVTFVWLGPPDLTVGVPVAVSVEVLVRGSALDAPTLLVSLPDTTRIAFASTTDSIVGVRPGRGDIAVRLASSLATTPVDTVFSLQIHP